MSYDSLHADRALPVVQRRCLIELVGPSGEQSALLFPREMHDNVSLATSRHARADAADRVHPQRFAVKYSHARAGSSLLGLSSATYISMPFSAPDPCCIPTPTPAAVRPTATRTPNTSRPGSTSGFETRASSALVSCRDHAVTPGLITDSRAVCFASRRSSIAPARVDRGYVGTVPAGCWSTCPGLRHQGKLVPAIDGAWPCAAHSIITLVRK